MRHSRTHILEKRHTFVRVASVAHVLLSESQSLSNDAKSVALDFNHSRPTAHGVGVLFETQTQSEDTPDCYTAAARWTLGLSPCVVLSFHSNHMRRMTHDWYPRTHITLTAQKHATGVDAPLTRKSTDMSRSFPTSEGFLTPFWLLFQRRLPSKLQTDKPIKQRSLLIVAVNTYTCSRCSLTVPLCFCFW